MSSPTRAQDVMASTTSNVEGVLADFMITILLNIRGKLTREGLIETQQLVSGNAVSVLSNLEGGWHIHLSLTITSTDYK